MSCNLNRDGKVSFQLCMLALFSHVKAFRWNLLPLCLSNVYHSTRKTWFTGFKMETVGYFKDINLFDILLYLSKCVLTVKLLQYMIRHYTNLQNVLYYAGWSEQFFSTKKCQHSQVGVLQIVCLPPSGEYVAFIFLARFNNRI